MAERTDRRRFIRTLVAGPLALTAAFAAVPHARAGGLPTWADETRLRAGTLPPGGKKFVPVMVTPYTDEGKIDFNHLSALVDFYLAAGARGLFANCLSSEMYNLSTDERIGLAEHVVKQVNGRVPVVACGSFGNNLEERAEFTKRMHQTGVKAVILITSHFALETESDDVLIGNFERFFGMTGNIPLGTYECPSPYKRLLTPKVFTQLLSDNRLIYHKDTSLDMSLVRAKLELAKGNPLEFFDAHAPNTMYSLQAGARGMSAIAGNFYPEIFVWMCDHALDQAMKEKVEWMQSEITRMDNVVSASYPRSSKYFLRKRGLPLREFSRSNTTPLTDKEKQVLDGVHGTFMGWCRDLGISRAFHA